MKPWTALEDGLLRRLAVTHTANQIGEVLGRSKFSVYGRAQRLGMSLPVKTGDNDYRTKHPDRLVERCRQMREDGMQVKAIAKKVAVPYSVVRAWVYYEARTSASL